MDLSMKFCMRKNILASARWFWKYGIWRSKRTKLRWNWIGFSLTSTDKYQIWKEKDWLLEISQNGTLFSNTMPFYIVSSRLVCTISYHIIISLRNTVFIWFGFIRLLAIQKIQKSNSEKPFWSDGKHKSESKKILRISRRSPTFSRLEAEKIEVHYSDCFEYRKTRKTLKKRIYIS